MFNLFKSRQDSAKAPTKPPTKKASTTTSKTTASSSGNSKKKTAAVASATTAASTPTKSGTLTKKWIGRSTPKTVNGSTSSSTRKGFPTSASTPSLSAAVKETKSSQNKTKRPITSVFDNITIRRGQSSKVGGGGDVQHHNTNEDLSRASSVTNLNAVPVAALQEQPHKGGGGGGGGGTKSKSNHKKTESKDRIDKLLGNNEKKNERKTSITTTQATRNNNREYDYVTATPEFDVELLQKQLTEMANEKTNLALQLGEQTGQLNCLQNEVTKLKVLQDQATQQLEQLVEENTLLRNRLRDVAHSPLSDNEKQQLLYESRHHSSAPASIATNLLDDGGDVTACPTPEWDKHSSSNVSEVSVACLQDKINQMQETHYSTNEELQATLQELTDLQRQLTELQQENERLIEEKNLMFESLCRQTERLNDSRNEVESLKKLLYNDENGHFETAAEREQKLVDLLKSAQEERETLLLKQEQLDNDLQDSRSVNIVHNDEIMKLSDRVRTLESTLDAKHAEHKLLDQELAQAKDQSSGRQIEINRLKDLLENAKAKINELEQDRTLGDKSELDELLDNARKEKDALESEVAHLKEQLALSRNEIEKLKEQVSILQEECKVIRNNARTTQSDLEYKVEKLILEKTALTEQLQQFQDALNELQVQTQCQQDDKRHLSAVLSETQRNLNESERKIFNLENELAEVKRQKHEQEEEWERFQNDLLTSVRVANDFKTEAQQDLQRMIMENKAERERVKQLEAQIDKLKVGTVTTSVQHPFLSHSRQSVKKREPSKKIQRSRKRLSKEEELLLESLCKLYDEIDPTVPLEQLTEEQRVIKRLKVIYDAEVPRPKPVAHKPKDRLAISKPLLNSVISNPKLGEIANNPNVQSVERLSVRNLDDFLDDLEKMRASCPPPLEDAQPPDLIKSKSLNDITAIADDIKPTSLRRINSTDHFAVTSIRISGGKNTKRDGEGVIASPPLIEGRESVGGGTVTFETLDEICSAIPPNTPEDQLSKEQKLALRLKKALAEGKTTLKKNIKIARKKIFISSPVRESVEKNSKLRALIQNPFMKNIPDYSKTQLSVPPVASNRDSGSSANSSNKSKSYEDIHFTFDLDLSKSTRIDMYSGGEGGGSGIYCPPIPPPQHFRDTVPSPSDDLRLTWTTFKQEDYKAAPLSSSSTSSSIKSHSNRSSVSSSFNHDQNILPPFEFSGNASKQEERKNIPPFPTDKVKYAPVKESQNICTLDYNTMRKEHNYLDNEVTKRTAEISHEHKLRGDDSESSSDDEDKQQIISKNLATYHENQNLENEKDGNKSSKHESESKSDQEVKQKVQIAPLDVIANIESNGDQDLKIKVVPQMVLESSLDNEQIISRGEITNDDNELKSGGSSTHGSESRLEPRNDQFELIYISSSSDSSSETDEFYSDTEGGYFEAKNVSVMTPEEVFDYIDSVDPNVQELDGEERQTRRGVQRVYSKVVEEIKEKYINDENLAADKEQEEKAEEEETNLFDSLTQEEMDMVNSVKARPGRPLSDISNDDLLLIENLKDKYLHDGSSIASDQDEVAKLESNSSEEEQEVSTDIEDISDRDEETTEASSSVVTVLEKVESESSSEDEKQLPKLQIKLARDIGIDKILKDDTSDSSSEDEKQSPSLQEKKIEFLKSTLKDDKQSESNSDNGKQSSREKKIKPQNTFDNPGSSSDDESQIRLNNNLTTEVEFQNAIISIPPSCQDFESKIELAIVNNNDTIKTAKKEFRSSSDEESDNAMIRNKEQPLDSKIEETSKKQPLAISKDSDFSSDSSSDDEQLPLQSSLTVLPPSSLNSQTIYEPVYANFAVVLPPNEPQVAQSTPLITNKKPIAVPRQSFRVPSEVKEQKLYENYGGTMKKSYFSIAYDDAKKHKLEEVTRSITRRNVQDLAKMFEQVNKNQNEQTGKRNSIGPKIIGDQKKIAAESTASEAQKSDSIDDPKNLQTYDSIDRMAHFHILNNVPFK